MSKRLLVSNFLLAAAAVFLFIQLVQVLSAPRFLPAPSAPPASQAAVSARSEPVATRPSLAVYGVVANRNLFNPNRSEAVAPPSSSVAPAAKPLLHGVVIDGETRLAYIEDSANKRVFGYRIGDSVAGGRLQQIEEDRVVIKRPEGSLEVKLKDPSKPKPVASAPKPSPGAVPPAALPPGGPPPSVTPSAPGVRPPPLSGVPRLPSLPQGQREIPGAPPPRQ